MSRKQKRIALYYLKQKLCGLALVIIGVLTVQLLEGDATGAIVLLPLGLYLLVTQERVMTFRI